MDDFLNTAKKSAITGGNILLEYFGKIEDSEVESKSKNNFVTYVDRLSEKMIIEKIHEYFPQHDILAEESDNNNTRKNTHRWIIDPLDGTTNFINQIPVFSVNIALEVDGEIVLGVTYDPVRNEMFHAIKNQGAYLNDKIIKISSKDDLNSSLIATGFPYKRKEQVDSYMIKFSDFMKNTCGIRRMGSAAIDLAYTACGRFDGFWELDLKIWDIAPGTLLVKEAGGVVTDINGRDEHLKTGNILASNKLVHSQMLKLLDK